MNKDILPKTYLIAIIGLIIITGINPVNRGAWLGEAALVFIAALTLTLTYKKFRFSNLSYTLIFIYLLFPLIGGHYTYSSIEMPFKKVFERNYLDRIVHFLSGFLLAVPLRELFVRTTKIKNIWSYLVPIFMVLAAGAVYEILEWVFFELINHESAIAFLGAQGDIWDTQKDLLMAGIGSVLIMIVSYIQDQDKNDN